MPRFEPHSDYGTCHPPHNGGVFVQRDRYFGPSHEYLFTQRADGSMYVEGEEENASSSTPSTQEATSKSVTKAVKKASAKASATPAAPVAAQGDGLDLAGWVKGEKAIGWFAVKKEISALYPDVDISSKAAAIAGLKSIGIGV